MNVTIHVCTCDMFALCNYVRFAEQASDSGSLSDSSSGSLTPSDDGSMSASGEESDEFELNQNASLATGSLQVCNSFQPLSDVFLTERVCAG